MVCCVGLLSNLPLILFFESWIFQPSKSICEYHLIFRDFFIFYFLKFNQRRYGMPTNQTISEVKQKK